jgi:hypothetical protein
LRFRSSTDTDASELLPNIIAHDSTFDEQQKRDHNKFAANVVLLAFIVLHSSYWLQLYGLLLHLLNPN